ncbi:MAG: molybdopterin cofactor-binding domain-containing protein [Woeseiaceae bacterium]|nr:molybdopterin cofactor-binding domain-containing protein [Woeseiaceae bacterium]
MPASAERRAASAANGRLRGIGFGCYVEVCSAMGGENTHIAFTPDGRVSVMVGTQSTGQGHETSYAQMAAAGLGVDIAQIDISPGRQPAHPVRGRRDGLAVDGHWRFIAAWHRGGRHRAGTEHGSRIA